LDIVVNDQIVQAFQLATSTVFKTMLGMEITAGPVEHCDQMIARHEVSGIISLSGPVAGDIVVSFEERSAMLATGAMLGNEPTELDNDVVDAVGELTNMIVGSAKGRLELRNLQLALPTVVMGKGHRIGFKAGICPISLPFTCQWGTFCVELALTNLEPAKQQPDAAGASASC
jgi:chemotaxis protein CheX